MLGSLKAFGAEERDTCVDNPTYACLEKYVQETRSLYAEYKNAHRIFYGIFDMAENADTIHSLVEISTLLAAGGATGLASGGIIPMALIGAALAYHTTSEIIDLTHKKRCAELCTSELAGEEEGKFQTPYSSYVEFILEYNDMHSSKFSDLRESESFIEKLEDRFKRVKKRWTPESLKTWWNNMGRAENQGLKCLTTCSISQGQGATAQLLSSSAEFKTSYGYTCKMLDVLPPKLASLMRFAQMLLLEHHFVKHRDEVKTSRLTKFLAATNDGKLCDNFKSIEKKINVLKTFHDILGKPPKVPVFTSKRILQKIFGKPCLHQAAEKGDVGKLDACLKKENINTTDALGKTALHQAAKYGNIGVMTSLLEKGANLDAKDDRGYTILHEAAKENRFEIIDFLANKVMDINPIDHEGKTPLHLAAENGHAQAVQHLLEFGAFSSTQDYKGNTPLHLAFKAKKETVLKELYTFADISAKDSDGNTVLHLAAQQQNETLVRHFVKIGADIGLKNRSGKTAFDLAEDAKKKMPLKTNQTYTFLKIHTDLLISSQKANTVDLLKAAFKNPDLNPNVTTQEGKTALMLAAQNGLSDIVTLLLSKPNVQVNRKDDNGKTALMLAAQDKHQTVFELILTNPKSKPKIRDNDWNTALHLAVQNKQKEIVKSFLNHVFLEERKKIFEIINEEGKAVFDLETTDDIKKILCKGYSELPKSKQLQTCKGIEIEK